MKLFELQSYAEVRALDKLLDEIMAPLGLNVKFSRHFGQRLLGRDRSITADEVVDSFVKLKQKYAQKLIDYKENPTKGTAVLKDFDNDINVIFGINQNPNKPLDDLTNITVMRKDPDKFRANTPSGSSEELKVGRKGN